MLAPSTYPPTSYILASVALTFFAYLGFGVIAFTGGDLDNPKKNMPRAMYLPAIRPGGFDTGQPYGSVENRSVTRKEVQRTAL